MKNIHTNTMTQKQRVLHIFYSDANDGYMIDVYDSDQAMVDGEDSLDGAICTGSYEDAIEWACDILKTNQ